MPPFQLGSMPLGDAMLVGALLRNCQVIAYGSQVIDHLGTHDLIGQVTLESYLNGGADGGPIA